MDNPGFFEWGTGNGVLWFNESSPFTRNISSLPSGLWQTDIDSNGDITVYSFTIGSVSVSPYTVQVIADVFGSHSGNLDASAGGYNTSLKLELTIRILGNGVGTSCFTPVFTANFEGGYVHVPSPNPPWTGPIGLVNLYTGTFGSSGSGGWIAVPAIGTGCNGQAPTIDAMFGFGAGGGLGALRIERLTAITEDNGGPVGS